MKANYLLIILLYSNCLFIRSETNSAENSPKNDHRLYNITQSNKMKITIGSKTFTATLYDHETAKAFKAMLPLTLKMDDFNSNEKKYDLFKSLPGQSANPETIHTGDLMLWSGHTLVLFYKTFSTQYSYVKLGHIDNPSGLAAALGAGSVTITYDLEK